MNFRGFPPGCGDSVADFWRLGRPWGATTLSRWCEWWYAGRWNTRRGLKTKSTNYPDHGHHGNISLQGKIPMVEPGIEPGTSWLVVRDSDRWTTRLVSTLYVEDLFWSHVCKSRSLKWDLFGLICLMFYVSISLGLELKFDMFGSIYESAGPAT